MDVPTRMLVMGAVLVAAMICGAAGVATGELPLLGRERGDIAATGVCEALGDSERAAAALNSVLPDREDYASRGYNPPRVGDDTSWRASCFVYGDGDQLLYADAELGWDASAAAWLRDPTRDYVDDEGRGREFRAGSAAVVTRNTAEILVPCVRRGTRPPYHLIVVVHAQQPLRGSTGANRRALEQLALGAARSAHRRARCPMPSQLPGALRARSPGPSPPAAPGAADRSRTG